MHAGNPVGPTAVLVGRTAVSANKAPVGRTALSASIIVPVRLLRNLIPVLVLLLLLTSCGMFTGTPHATRPAVGTASMPPAAGELEAALTAELIRLGKSPSDSTPHAPAGSTNAVFDLACSVVDPDGEPDGEGGGELPPTGITLGWTERLLGDYNLDGQVNAGDLAPLGINWLQAVQYDSAVLHGGIAYWPQGSAVDDGGSPYPAPPATGSGARNWRLARIDAQSDGVLDVKDVTPIAVHWCEQSSGYRVYVKLPGGTEFLLVPEDGSTLHQPAAGEVTLPRTAAFPAGKSSADPTRPVRFGCTYEDGGHGGPPHGLPEGRYEYYVTAYDAATDSEGPASAHVVIDITGGVANQPPVAVLTVSPDFAGAPAVITFDASQSHDPDGSIKEYRWDFDADGVVDWSTADETVPEQSSGGEVDTITPGEAPGAGLPPASVTVTYERAEGYANYLYPRVTVVDDKEGTAMKPVKLGVSGWEILETLSSNKDEFNPPGDELVIYGDFQFEPDSGYLAVVGANQGFSGLTDFGDAVMYGRRIAAGNWEYEKILASRYNWPEDFSGEIAFGKPRLYWDANGQPMAVFNPRKQGMSGNEPRIYIARRSITGQWSVSVLYAGSPVSPGGILHGADVIDIVQTAPGELAILAINWIADPSEPNWYNYQYVTYIDGAVNVEPIGWPEVSDPTNSLDTLGFDSTGAPFAVVKPSAADPASLWLRKRLSPGVWENVRIDNNIFSGIADRVDFRESFFDSSGILTLFGIISIGEYDGIDDTFGLIRCDDSQPIFIPLMPYTTRLVYLFRETPAGISLLSSDFPTPPGSKAWSTYHDLYTADGIHVTERPYLIEEGNTTDYTSFQAMLFGPDKNLYTVFKNVGGEYPGAKVMLFARRVDPRSAP